MTVVLAHPLTEAARLGVAPAFVALLGALVAIVVAVGVARTAPTAPHAGAAAAADVPAADPPAQPLPQVGRAVGVALLLLVVAAGRLGAAEQIDNIAPTLLIGVGWPALLLLSVLVGGVWDWLNPFDTLAVGAERLAGEPAAPPRSTRVLPLAAAAGAAGWAWWLAGYLPGGLQPRAIGLALGAYTLVTLAGCVWVGRRAWLGRAEVFTVTFRAIAASRSPRGTGSAPEHLPVIGLLLGGLAFAELRFSSWYLSDLATVGVHDATAAPVVVAGFVVACAAGVGSILVAARWARRLGTAGALQIAAPWMVVGLGLSAALERDRLWNAAQLAAVQLSDPFGLGWDLFGTASWQVVPWHHGDVARLWVQVAVLTGTAAAGLALALRRQRRGGEPIAVVVCGWLLIAILSAASL